MSKVIRIGLAGLGTVGAGVLKILQAQRDDLLTKTGCRFDVVAVAARSPSKMRTVDISNCAWVEAPADLARRDDVDVVVEAMGGDGEPALGLMTAALQAGKPVVTANKALLARHGLLLAQLSEECSVSLSYEAAVAGGIPIIKMLREGLVANTLDSLYGILNGTCNYILTAMEQTERCFADVLAEAQQLGYAESDPALDIDGGDSGHKLALLAALAFGVMPDFSGMEIGGIRHITPDDISTAKEFGYRIKLVGQARRLDDGRILQMVRPSLLPQSSPLAHVDGVLNGIVTHSNFAGATFIAGRGAGAEPTASAIVSDLVDIARGGVIQPVFGRNVSGRKGTKFASFSEWSGAFYMRVVVKDQPGVIADIAPILRDHSISIESLVQRGRSMDQPVNIALFTHTTSGKAVHDAVQAIAQLDTVTAPPFVMPVLAI